MQARWKLAFLFNQLMQLRILLSQAITYPFLKLNMNDSLVGSKFKCVITYFYFPPIKFPQLKLKVIKIQELNKMRMVGLGSKKHGLYMLQIKDTYHEDQSSPHQTHHQFKLPT